jgi:hypothetical protein
MQILVKSGEGMQLYELRAASHRRAQSWHEAVLAATHGDKPRQALKSASNGPFGDGEDAAAFSVTDEWILLGSVTDEIAVGHPLRLHELKLPPEMRPDQEEDAAALSAVLLEHALGQWPPIVRATPQEFVEIDVDDVILQGIAWVNTTDVPAEGALHSLYVADGRFPL